MDQFAPQPLPEWRRAVLKVGSSLLADGVHGLVPTHAAPLAAFVRAAQEAGREVVLVSSGAVAAGRAIAGQGAAPGAAMAERQALAALGQARLVGFWQSLVERPVAQVLLTHDDLRDRRRYLNARATLRELLARGALPVVNENDTVAVDELKVGDNDNLAAIVAALVDADLLLLATDVDGLYDADPRRVAGARLLADVPRLTDAVCAAAGGAGSGVGTGGMRTKLEAARRAAQAGIDTVLFNGTRGDVLRALSAGRLHGTRIHSARSRVAARKHWLHNAPLAAGAILVDDGAAQALAGKGASLLPGGVVEARGEFHRGDLVALLRRGADGAEHTVARGLSQYSAADIRRIARRHSREVEAILGYNYGGNIVHRDDLVLSESQPGPASTGVQP
jgi:glutamate 5-kinase